MWNPGVLSSPTFTFCVQVVELASSGKMTTRSTLKRSQYSEAFCHRDAGWYLNLKMPIACHSLGAYMRGLGMMSRDPHDSPVRALSLLPQYYRWRNGGTETFSNLPQVTKLEGGRAALNSACETPGPQTLVSVCPFFLLSTQTLEIRSTYSDFFLKWGH